MHRTVKADNPIVEIKDAQEQIEKTGYCWWGCAKAQTFSETLLVLENGNSKSGANGILYASQLLRVDEISRADLLENSPRRWVERGELGMFQKFAKITKAVHTDIPNSRLLHVNSGQTLDGKRWRSNMVVQVPDSH